MNLSNASLRLDLVLNNTFGVIGRNPLLFFGIALVFCGIPLLGAYSLSGYGFFPGFISLTIFGGLGYFVLITLVHAMLVIIALEDLNGRSSDLGQVLTSAGRKILPLIGLSIVTGIGLMIGFILLVIPGIILYTMWYITVPTMMAEDTTIFRSIDRSSSLTEGSRLKILLLAVGLWIMSSIIGVFSEFLIGFSDIALIGNVFSAVSDSIISVITAAATAAIYFDLKEQKEGSDETALTDIFA